MSFEPYASAVPFFDTAKAPTHVVDPEDKLRLQSYDLYENIYWSVPQTFKIMQRGQDSRPIYLPSARKMIEACNRFLGVDFGFFVTGTDSEDERIGVTALLHKLFKRENFFMKYATQKRYGLIRGDALWHIVGDPTKVPGEGEALSIYELDPRTYFPIFDKDNAEKRIGCHLVDIITDPNDANKSKKVARRQTYLKEETGEITSELAYFEPNAWDDRHLEPKDIKRLRTVTNKFALPPAITMLPVYEIPNNRIPGKTFGYSELLGVERVFAAVNQAVSDEELSLAMAGLGVFWTTAGPPVDTAGNIVPWDIGPAQVVEVAKDTSFNRLQGVTSVAPMIDHMRFILDETQGGLGIPDIAAGKVDVTVAESGISLQLQLAPLLAKNAEKELTLISSYDQFFYDLVHSWMVAFEGVSDGSTATAVAVVGDPMPKNRKAQIDEIITLVGGNLISIEEGRIRLQKLGYEFEGTAADPIISQERELARARNADPYIDRLNEETGTAGQGATNSNNGTVPIPGVPA